jgi:peptidyl-prolyl cis-trans isomerase C
VLVIVNGKPITQSEFEFRWSEIPTSTQARYRSEGGKRKFLDDLISRELLLQEARRLGLDQMPSLRERLERVKEQLTLDELMRAKMNVQVEVPKEELDSYYASHAAEFLPGDQTARERLRQELYAEKRRARFEQYLSSLRTSATIRMADASRFITEGTGRPSADGAR